MNLVTVAQAFHWFDHPKFAEAVRSVAADECKLVVWSYAVTRIFPEVDAVVDSLYNGLLGSYWEKERRHVENGYRDLVMPFKEIPAPKMSLRVHWNKDQFSGYLKTWSALQTYLKNNTADEVVRLLNEIETVFGDGAREVSWPLNIRVWKIR